MQALRAVNNGPSSCTASHIEAVRSRTDPHCTSCDQATSHSDQGVDQELGQAHEEALCGCGGWSELDGPVAGSRSRKSSRLVERQSSAGGAAATEGARGRACGAALCAAGSCPHGMSAAQWAEGLATALPGSQAAFNQGLDGWLSGTRPTAGEISDSDDDELWRRMNQASTVCGVSGCGASTGQPLPGGLTRVFGGWVNVDTTRVTARIRWLRGSSCSAGIPPERLGAGQQSACQARFRSFCDREG